MEARRSMSGFIGKLTSKIKRKKKTGASSEETSSEDLSITHVVREKKEKKPQKQLPENLREGVRDRLSALLNLSSDGDVIDFPTEIFSSNENSATSSESGNREGAELIYYNANEGSNDLLDEHHLHNGAAGELGGLIIQLERALTQMSKPKIETTQTQEKDVDSEATTPSNASTDETSGSDNEDRRRKEKEYRSDSWFLPRVDSITGSESGTSEGSNIYGNSHMRDVSFDAPPSPKFPSHPPKMQKKASCNDLGAAGFTKKGQVVQPKKPDQNRLFGKKQRGDNTTTTTTKTETPSPSLFNG